jgi:riboflavin kinase / FMN adenylyltransferase
VFRDSASARGPCVVCIGAFDGVHLAHQEMLRTTVARAKALGIASALVTFDPLPRAYFKQPELLCLTPTRQKLALIAATGIDQVLALRFTPALAAMTPAQFVQQILVQGIAAREVHIGADFRFGHGRTGSLATLHALGAAHEFSVHALPDVSVAGERVSASKIRAAILAGEFSRAAQFLGRRFSFSGRVLPGQRLGRTLGYPTANLAWPSGSALSGVFAVRVSGAGLAHHPAVASLGTRPVVNGVEPLLEVHLFDFTGDLYGQRLAVEFVAKQREEWNFPDLASLVRQIDLDAAAARAILALPNTAATA